MATVDLILKRPNCFLGWWWVLKDSLEVLSQLPNDVPRVAFVVVTPSSSSSPEGSTTARHSGRFCNFLSHQTQKSFLITFCQHRKFVPTFSTKTSVLT
jgi:hypothetical protein